MATLRLCIEDLDSNDKKQPGRPIGYSVAGFECGGTAVVSTRPGNPHRWVVHLAPAGTRLQAIPISFSDPEGALKFLQEWVDKRDALVQKRTKVG